MMITSSSLTIIPNQLAPVRGKPRPSLAEALRTELFQTQRKSLVRGILFFFFLHKPVSQEDIIASKFVTDVKTPGHLLLKFLLASKKILPKPSVLLIQITRGSVTVSYTESRMPSVTKMPIRVPSALLVLKVRLGKISLLKDMNSPASTTHIR